MYVVKEAIELDEKQIVANAMSGVGMAERNVMSWGYWDGDICVGGINLYNLNSPIKNDNFSIGFSVAPNFKLGYAIYFSVRAALKISPRLIAKVAMTNLSSRKGARQLGFKPIYVEDGNEVLELYKISDNLHRRWKSYVSSI